LLLEHHWTSGCIALDWQLLPALSSFEQVSVLARDDAELTMALVEQPAPFSKILSPRFPRHVGFEAIR
jgi:hypothetical protein